MKLTLERTAFLKSLGHVQSVVERRNTIPILSNLRMTASAEGLGLNATDMDLEITESIPATVSQPGATTAPAHTLYDIVRKLPDGSQVELSHEGGDGPLVLRAGRSRFQLACLPVDDFPVMSPGDFSHSFVLPAADLRALIDRTRFAISTEETRYYLNGIFLHATEAAGQPVLRAVATDGHRLACVEIPLPEGAAGMPAVIVPRKTVTELRKLVEETGMVVNVSLSEHKIRFAFDDVCLISKLIDGKFPDYERVIPTDNDKILEVARQPFAQATDRVAAISTEKSRAIKVAVAAGTLTLSASSPEAGSAVEEIEASYGATPLEIGFNARYLLDILDQVKGDAVRLHLADSSSPTVLRDAADASAVYVLMPMRV
ncbi:DNA polymerase III subunit beta [Pararhodospirillum photometricum]|nr:DNA polymerase III subunit beta [Pararhodospirillum photometricum]